jgi:hypothetical protein
VVCFHYGCQRRWIWVGLHLFGRKDFLKPHPIAEKWTVGRTRDGQPDLEGVWDAASLTPLERPADLGNKEFYTPEEIAAYEKKRAHDLDGDRRDGSADTDLGRAYNRDRR